MKQVSLEELCRTADILSVHARLVPETENMIGRAQFALMKPNAILINTARAGLVDRGRADRGARNQKDPRSRAGRVQGRAAAAGFAALKMDNVTLMPHSAGITGDIVKNGLNIITTELERFLTGEPLRFNAR